jgi:hypothetical protein
MEFDESLQQYVYQYEDLIFLGMRSLKKGLFLADIEG